MNHNGEAEKQIHEIMEKQRKQIHEIMGKQRKEIHGL